MTKLEQKIISSIDAAGGVQIGAFQLLVCMVGCSWRYGHRKLHEMENKGFISIVSQGKGRAMIISKRGNFE